MNWQKSEISEIGSQIIFSQAPWYNDYNIDYDGQGIYTCHANDWPRYRCSSRLYEIDTFWWLPATQKPVFQFEVILREFCVLIGPLLSKASSGTARHTHVLARQQELWNPLQRLLPAQGVVSACSIQLAEVKLPSTRHQLVQVPLLRDSVVYANLPPVNQIGTSGAVTVYSESNWNIWCHSILAPIKMDPTIIQN